MNGCNCLYCQAFYRLARLTQGDSKQERMRDTRQVCWRCHKFEDPQLHQYLEGHWPVGECE